MINRPNNIIDIFCMPKWFNYIRDTKIKKSKYLYKSGLKSGLKNWLKTDLVKENVKMKYFYHHFNQFCDIACDIGESSHLNIILD